MNSNKLVYGGKAISDFGIMIFSPQGWNKPQPSIDKVSIPGRNGDIYYFNGNYSNISLEYVAIIQNDFATKYEALASYLYADPGYKRLEDGDRPDVFRMAAVTSIVPQIGKDNDSGRVRITFDCKPQQWLKSGEIPVTLTATGTVYNPTRFDARPLMRVYGTGELSVGDGTISILQANGYTDIDFEEQEAYKDDYSVNCNENIYVAGHDFPVLHPGPNTITLGQGITRVDLKSRWWKI